MTEPTRYAKGGIIFPHRHVPPCEYHQFGQPERVIGGDLKPWPFLVRVCTICGAAIRNDQEPAL